MVRAGSARHYSTTGVVRSITCWQSSHAIITRSSSCPWVRRGVWRRIIDWSRRLIHSPRHTTHQLYVARLTAATAARKGRKKERKKRVEHRRGRRTIDFSTCVCVCVCDERGAYTGRPHPTTLSLLVAPFSFYSFFLSPLFAPFPAQAPAFSHWCWWCCRIKVHQRRADGIIRYTTPPADGSVWLLLIIDWWQVGRTIDHRPSQQMNPTSAKFKFKLIRFQTTTTTTTTGIEFKWDFVRLNESLLWRGICQSSRS